MQRAEPLFWSTSSEIGCLHVPFYLLFISSLGLAQKVFLTATTKPVINVVGQWLAAVRWPHWQHIHSVSSLSSRTSLYAYFWNEALCQIRIRAQSSKQWLNEFMHSAKWNTHDHSGQHRVVIIPMVSLVTKALQHSQLLNMRHNTTPRYLPGVCRNIVLNDVCLTTTTSPAEVFY